MSKTILLLSILVVLTVSGCVQTTPSQDLDDDGVPNIQYPATTSNENEAKCEPNYINAGSDFLNNLFAMDTVEACKKACFDKYEVSSYKLEEDSQQLGGKKCSCDVNDCCGDGVCGSEESCSVCPEDCGECPRSLLVHDDQQTSLAGLVLTKINNVNYFVASRSKMQEGGGLLPHNINVPIEFSYNAENITAEVVCDDEPVLETDAIHVLFQCESGSCKSSGEIWTFEIAKAYKNDKYGLIAQLYFLPGYVVDGTTLSCRLLIDVKNPPQKETVNLYPIMIRDDST